ncbi:hypothetical protein QZH41_001559 [Actinostola sp. cb2023]|nr:hypothetical protein QZH41_001559 [Actinostola sp. cb2023]
MADEAASELQHRQKKHSAYFNSLVRLVPAKFYLPDDDEEKSNKFYKNRGKAAPKQIIKEASRKAKKKRLDPNQSKNVIDLQEQQETANDESDKSDSEDDGNNNSQGFSVEKVPSGKIADLRARLHERIELLQGKRRAIGDSDQHSKRPKKKMKSEIKSHKKKMNEISQNKQDQSNTNTARISSGKKVINDQGEIVFSKFDFMERGKNPKHGSKMRNYKNLIAKAETRKKKIEELKGQDVNKAKEMEERHAWKSAIEKAEGNKVKDDPKLLKKSLKRKEKLKTKSKKQWDARKDHQNKQMEDKQKRRQKNLKERAEAKKGKKGGKGKKHRPGF